MNYLIIWNDGSSKNTSNFERFLESDDCLNAVQFFDWINQSACESHDIDSYITNDVQGREITILQAV